MTVKDVAMFFSITPAAVYKAVKAHKLRISDLMDPATKQLTEEGEAQLMDMFELPAVDNQLNQVESQVDNQQTPVDQPVDNQITELTTRLKAVEEENARLKTDLAAAQAEVQGLRDQLGQAIQSLQHERDALERAQQLQALTLQKLPALPAPKTGIFSRLFHRKGGAQDADS